MSEIARIEAPDATPEDWRILDATVSIADHNPIRSEREAAREHTGWNFRTGDPEIHAHEAELVVPGGKVLDLGMGSARTSMFFAMHGMEVMGYDADEYQVAGVNEFGEKFGLPIHGEAADIKEIDLGTEEYDVVVLSQLFVHFESTEAAYAVLAKAIRAVKPGGHIYLRTVGTQDHEFQTRDERWVTPSDDDPNVYWEECGCSGYYQMEPHLFMDAPLLMAYMYDQGLEIKHSQTAPERGQFNVMYGADWHVKAHPDHYRQMITVIGRKPIPPAA